MRNIKYSELLPFLHGLNLNGEVSAGEIEDIIVDYNGQYMYIARITYDSYHCRWMCEPKQPTHGTGDGGLIWRISPYGGDHRTVRTNSHSNGIHLNSMPTLADSWDAQPMVTSSSMGRPITMREAELRCVQAGDRAGRLEEVRRGAYEESRRRSMESYEGRADTESTREALSTELRTLSASYDARPSITPYDNHTHVSDSATCSLAEANVPNATEEEQRGLGDLLRRYMSFGRTD